MKIFKLLLLSAVFVLFSACGGNDDDIIVMDEMTEDPPPSIIGEWQLTSMQLSGTSSETTKGSPVDATFTGFGKNMDFSIIFTEDPNEYVRDGTYTVELTTTIDGEISVDNSTHYVIDVMGNWSIDNTELTMIDGLAFYSNITTLDDTTLILETDISNEIRRDLGLLSTDAISITTYTRQ